MKRLITKFFSYALVSLIWCWQKTGVAPKFTIIVISDDPVAVEAQLQIGRLNLREMLPEIQEAFPMSLGGVPDAMRAEIDRIPKVN